jgi:hypothetical protein
VIQVHFCLRSSRAIVESWTRQEAKFKAGSSVDLVVRELPVPWPGHVMAVAHGKGATVDLHPIGSLGLARGGSAELPMPAT